MRNGDLLRVDHFGEHPAVLIDVHMDGTMLVICGTGTHRPHDPTIITVRPRDPAGIALELTKPTHFYETKVAVVQPSAVRRQLKKTCPPKVLHALEDLARSAAAKGLVQIPAPQPIITVDRTE